MDTEFNSDEDSTSLSKRILRVADFTNATTSEKRLYPKGIVGSLQTLDFEFPIVNRIEPFARKDRGKRRYGILRKLFTAFSSEPGILGLANASSNVIEVHGMQRAGLRKEITESKLVLKHSEGEAGGTGQRLAAPYTEHTPSLLVSRHWLDLMKLSSGDRVIISNPRENYEIPPPILSDEKK